MRRDSRAVGRRARRSVHPGLAWFRSRLAAVVVALSLLLQVAGLPYSQALAAAGQAGAAASIAAELKATFGANAGFCTQATHEGRDHSPLSPAGDCCDQCPLCRFAAQAVAFVPPDALALPERLGDDGSAIGAALEFGPLPAFRAKRNRARAPPLAV